MRGWRCGRAIGVTTMLEHRDWSVLVLNATTTLTGLAAALDISTVAPMPKVLKLNYAIVVELGRTR